ncbi:hypothetical protein M8Z33_42025 [Streptomyces sp. ZAF1911]|uniref:hypothetical protein n=1 Tax=Streptomyces sp. ZAF1911 TaxID=2944129 RepID=UPI00237BC54A|nr:hypothetical protein [Streptomyces sp. ZAF1911]MDD9383117.1 hypothetical protein [Streptomyces sp. ZAF1911]
MGITALRRDAELLSLYTGLPYQSALGIAGDAPRRQGLIPAPGPQQELLERWLLRRLAWPSCDPVYPWGIKWVHPTADGLTVRFEGDSMARELARVLPPRADPAGELHGIPGARFSPPSAKGITMIWLGTSARILLTGITPAAWKSALAAEEREARECELVSCYRTSPTSWTEHERGDGALLTPRAARTASTAWLASGLLRRVGLWRTPGVPLSTTSWVNPARSGEQWIIDHIHEPTATTVRHGTFVRLLSAPGWGLPLKEVDCWCRCPAEMCVVTMVSPSGAPGELELRFPRRISPHFFAEYDADLYSAKLRVPVKVPRRLLPGAAGPEHTWKPASGAQGVGTPLVRRPHGVS